jgi:hypothetical protein
MSTNSAQSVDLNGYLLIEGCPLSSYGIYDYSAAQVGEENGDPMRIVKVFRPESTLRDPELLRTLSVVPFIDDHDYLSGDPNASEEDGMDPDEKGVAGVLFNIRWDAPWLRGDIKIFSRRLRRAIEQGKKDLSLGYVAKFIRKPGVWRGQPYEYIQLDMRANHIALVDEARVAGARVLDGLVFDSMRLDVTPSKSKIKEPVMADENKENEDRRAGDSDLGELVAILQGLAPKLKAAIQELEGGEANGEPDPEEGNEGAEGSTEELEEGNGEHSQEGVDTETALGGGGSENSEQPGDKRRELADAVRMLDELMPKARQLCGVSTGDEHEEIEDGKEGEAVNVNHEKDIEDGALGLLETGKEENRTMPELHTGDETDGETGGRVSKGPAKGKNDYGTVGGDAALKRVYADVAKRDELYARFSPIVGVFDHKSMTANETAKYLVKKLKLDASKSSAMQVLDSYYLGRQAVRAKAVIKQVARVGDSASVGMSAGMTKFLNGG